MTFDELPDVVVASAFDVSMILYAEHSFNASTFTARVIASTGADMAACVVGAVGALSATDAVGSTVTCSMGQLNATATAAAASRYGWETSGADDKYAR